MEQRVTSNSELDCDRLRFHLSRFLNHLHQPFHNLVFYVLRGEARGLNDQVLHFWLERQ